MSRVRVARSRVRPMVRVYIAHVGVDPPGVTAAGLGIQESHENEVLKKEGACEGTESEK